MDFETKCGWVRCRAPDVLDDGRAEDGIAVKNQVSRRSIVGKRLAQLLHHPRRCRMECGVEVNDVSTAVLDDEETVQEPERRGRYGEQIHRSDVVLVVAQERHPSLDLVRLGRSPRQIPRHRHLRHDEPELGELGMDTRRFPAVLRHRPNQMAHLRVNPGTTRMASLGNLRPVAAEPLPIPLGDRVGLHEDQSIRPARP